MRYLPNFRLATNNSLSTVRRAVIGVALTLLFPTAIYGASSLPTTLPTSVPVTVVNSPTVTTVPAEDPAKNGFVIHFAMAPNQPEQCQTVPVGKRAVIEFVSYQIQVAAGTYVLGSVRLGLGASSMLHYVPLLQKAADPYGSEINIGAIPLRAYTDTQFCATRFSQQPIISGGATITGYYVNVP